MELLGHELTHVLQQRAGRVQAGDQAAGEHVSDQPELEREAWDAGRRVARGQRVQLPGGHRPVVVSQHAEYVDLSYSQQKQVDGVSEGVFYAKTVPFEQQVGAVAGAHPDAAADVVLLYDGLVAETANAWLGERAAAGAGEKLDRLMDPAFGGEVGAVAEDPAVDASHRDDIQSTLDLPEGAIPQADGTMDLVGGGNVPLVPTAAGVIARDSVDAASVVRPDSAIAEGARGSMTPTRGAGSRAAAQVFQLGQHRGFDQGHLRGLRLACYAELLPPRVNTLPEVNLAGDAVGLLFTPGPDGYRDIQPLNETSVGLLYPDFFLTPRFKIELARALYPDDAAQRADALAMMPADVTALVTNIVEPGFVRLQADALLQPLLDTGLPRVAIETLDDASIASLTAVIAGDQLAGLVDWDAVAATAAYGTVVAGSDANTADQIFAYLYVLQHGADAVPQQVLALATIVETERAGFASDADAEPHGYTDDEQQRAADLAQHNVNVFGAVDRHVANEMPPDALGLVEGTAINEYTGGNFGAFHASYRDSASVGAMGDAEAVQWAARLRAASTGLAQLPVYQGGSVYSGKGYIQTALEANQAELAWAPGKLYAPRELFSASKTLNDSGFNGPTSLVFVVDDIKTGRDVQVLSEFAYEREVLFGPASRFVVSRNDNALTPNPPGVGGYDGGHLWVYLREIGDAPSADEQLERRAQWDRAATADVEPRRFIDREHYEEAERLYMTEQPNPANADALTPPSERYGGGDIANWVAAEAFMAANAGAPLSVDMILQMHQLAADGLGIAGGPGLYRDEQAFGLGGFAGYDLVSDAQLAGLEANDTIELVRMTLADLTALPELAAPDAQAAIQAMVDVGRTNPVVIAYPHGLDPAAGHDGDWVRAQLAASVQGFVDAYNDARDLVLAAEPDARRALAVEFAAIAQQRFISIHPFPDGNGRTSRLIMDHALLTAGQRPAILANPGADLESTQAEWTGQIDQGLGEYDRLRALFNL